MQDNTDTQTSLTSDQKSAVFLLSVGTFLEYFDLMLYVHMAVLLNDLFFPKTDPFTASLMSAFAFCATYVLRPFGALIFGWIGDHVGRKHTVVITTFLMACSCITMATLPTYTEIGILASWVVVICRMLQGMSSMGESKGAELYLTEITKPPMRYPVVALIGFVTTVGSTAALILASLVTTNSYFNWRSAFWIGASISLIGVLARTTLRETPDFADAKCRVKSTILKAKHDVSILKNNLIYNQKVDKKTIWSLFFIQCLWPVTFYIVYIHCANILKNSLGCTSEEVIAQNLIVSSCQFVTALLTVFLSYKIHPLKILKIKSIIFLLIAISSPFLLINATSPFQILIFQISLFIIVPSDFPAASVFSMHFPVFKRFTYVCLMYALSRAVMSIITSFGIAYLVNSLGDLGILVILLPLIVGYWLGLAHFEKMERSSNNYY